MLLLIGSNPQQGDAPLVGILVEHVERQRIVDIVTHVGIENHLHGRLFRHRPGAARTKSRAQGYDSGKIFQISQHMKKF